MPSRNGKPRKRSSRNSYQNFSRIARIEKDFAVLKLRKTQQLRTDDVPWQELQERQSTVNQHTVPLQEVQDRLNSLNDFHGPEMTGSSGFSHVPSHRLIVRLTHGTCVACHEAFL